MKIQRWLFLDMFAADSEFHTHAQWQEAYLDCQTGEINFLITDTAAAIAEVGEAAVKDARGFAAKYKRNPGRYLLIPSLSHGDHHEILQHFLETEWCGDPGRRDAASATYYERKSIGYWTEHVGNQDAIQAFYAYREAEVLRLTCPRL